MDTNKIRSLLSKMASRHGQLKKFCEQNNLPYFTVWRIANGKTERIEHELGIKLSELLADQLLATGSEAGV